MQQAIKTILLLAYGYGAVERAQAWVYKVRYGSSFQFFLALGLAFLTFLIEL